MRDIDSVVSELLKSLKLSTCLRILLQTFPDRRVNPARMRRRCDALVLFPRQPLYASAWFSSLWCADKGGVGGGCLLCKIKTLSPSFDTVARRRLRSQNKTWFLDHPLYQQCLMKSFRVTQVILVGKVSARRRDKRKTLEEDEIIGKN